MGSYGSTRWAFHYKKIQVEECLKLSIFSLKPYLHPGFKGASYWYRGENKIGSIDYRVLGMDKPTTIKLIYSITPHNGEKINFDYGVHLTTTPLAWGGERYWFICPLSANGQSCSQRVGCLYLPPNGQYFGCRHCYNLTYQSSQESGQFNGFYEIMAATMQDEYPGINSRDVRYLLEDKHTSHMEQLATEKFLREWEPPPDRHSDYLTAEELCRESGLSIEDLIRLGEARLLVPDTSDGRYRPKLVGWAKKLGYLIQEGWEYQEIKRWAVGRFDSENPMQWPPERAQ